MPESYTIGELARAAGVHLETVRYYERRGLVEPPPRTASGYRQYSADDLWRLQFVVRAKQLGFTLSEVGELLGHGGAEDVLDVARAKIAAVDEQMAELARTRCRLESLARLCEDGDANCVTLRVP